MGSTAFSNEGTTAKFPKDEPRPTKLQRAVAGTMKAATLITALASTAIGVAAADELKIEKTQTVACDRRTQKGDMVSMHYHGTLADTGNKFDASYDRGQPLRFKVGSGQVIKGWDQGLLDMCIGDKRTLTIPPELGYGQRAIGPIPAGSTLIFETELVGIDGVPKPEKIAEKVASVVAEAADAAKTILADTDDAPVHE